MKKTPIIKPRATSREQEAAKQPADETAAEVGGGENRSFQGSTQPNHSSSQIKYVIAVGVAMVIVGLLVWMASRSGVAQSADNSAAQRFGDESLAKAGQSLGDDRRVLERLKDASIKMSNAVERYRDAVATRKAAEALKDKPALIEATQEIERAANDALTETRRAYAEALTEAYGKRANHPADFDSAVSAYGSELEIKQLKMQSAEFARGIERVKAAPQGADMGYFERVATGIF